jgi:hypothetical protein
VTPSACSRSRRASTKSRTAIDLATSAGANLCRPESRGAKLSSPELEARANVLALAHTVTPDALERALQEQPDVQGMLAVSPTAVGVAADVAGLAQVCRRATPELPRSVGQSTTRAQPSAPTGAMRRRRPAGSLA